MDLTQRVLEEVADERERQNSKWGEQNHDAFTWLAILGEEVGEANRGALEARFGGNGNRAVLNYRQELLHSAAVCVAAVECLDRAVEKEQTELLDSLRSPAPRTMQDGRRP